MEKKEFQEHIVAIKASKVSHRERGFVNYKLTGDDLMIGKRETLESDPDFRQVLSVCALTHEGKVWAYRRAPKGGEKRLYGKVAVAVGGHWDLDDILSNGSVIDVEKSMEIGLQRELEEEVNMTSKIIKANRLDKVIAADDTEVDRLHIAIVTLFELDGEEISAGENKLDPLGFFTPQELLDSDHNLETWASIICQMLVDQPELLGAGAEVEV